VEKTWTWSMTGYQFEEKSHQEIQDICVSSGLSGIECVPPLLEGYSIDEIEKIGSTYEEAGLIIETFHLPFSAEDDISSFYETTRRKAVDKACLWMERASAVGASVGIQHPTTNRFSVDDEGLDKYFDKIGRSLDVLLPAAEKLGFSIALENMLPAGGARFTSRPTHFEQILNDFDHPSLGFCLDTGHALVAGGENAVRFQEVMGSHLRAYHLADNAGDRDSHLAPGHGLVDWQTTFRIAAKQEYRGAMCIETPPFAQGPDYSLEAWKALVTDTDALVEKAIG
jgi:sugar phosphate isomerase/epimerase